MKKAVVGVLVFLLTGCLSGTSKPSKFYSIRSENDGAAISEKARFSVGIEEVKVPAYLDRPQLVTLKDSGVELNVSEINRWSEPLSVMLQRALADDIGDALPRAVVKSKNYGRENFDYAVFVELNQLDGRLGGEAVLDAWWSAFNKDNKMLLRQRVKLQRPAGQDYDALVQAESALVSQLAREIATKLARF